MKEENTNRLIKKYKEGESTLKEEEHLFNTALNADPTLKNWATFVKKNKGTTPSDLNERLWEAFEPKTSTKNRLLTVLLSTAAAVLIGTALLITFQQQKKNDYAEKEALLSQALDMVTSSNQVQPNEYIIYENDMVIIYTTSE